MKNNDNNKEVAMSIFDSHDIDNVRDITELEGFSILNAPKMSTDDLIGTVLIVLNAEESISTFEDSEGQEQVLMFCYRPVEDDYITTFSTARAIVRTIKVCIAREFFPFKCIVKQAGKSRFLGAAPDNVHQMNLGF